MKKTSRSSLNVDDCPTEGVLTGQRFYFASLSMYPVLIYFLLLSRSLSVITSLSPVCSTIYRAFFPISPLVFLPWVIPTPHPLSLVNRDFLLFFTAVFSYFLLLHNHSCHPASSKGIGIELQFTHFFPPPLLSHFTRHRKWDCCPPNNFHSR